MITDLNIQIDGPHGRPILIDVYAPMNDHLKQVIVFAHGFKGFKDWGFWDIMAREFAEKGFVFVKFNFSHNGVGTDNMHVFTELEAFSDNKLSWEMDDMGEVIDWILDSQQQQRYHLDPNGLTLMGHSRGGGIALCKAMEDQRVKKIMTLAAVRSFERFGSEEDRRIWKENGVTYIPNARTGQQMPLKWSLYEDFQQNMDRLDIEEIIIHLFTPLLVIQGAMDEVVPYADGLHIYENTHDSEFKVIIDGDHVFGGGEPWEKDKLPGPMREVMRHCVEFMRHPERGA